MDLYATWSRLHQQGFQSNRFYNKGRGVFQPELLLPLQLVSNKSVISC